MHLAQAHDPGLSRARVQLHETGITLHMIFAWQDIKSWLPMDTDHDGTVAVDELSAAKSHLQSNIVAEVNMRYAEGLLQPASVCVALLSDDDVKIMIEYKHSEISVMQLHLPLIAQLARGHRMYLTVLDADNNQHAQYLLNADSLPIILQTSGFDA